MTFFFFPSEHIGSVASTNFEIIKDKNELKQKVGDSFSIVFCSISPQISLELWCCEERDIENSATRHKKNVGNDYDFLPEIKKNLKLKD